MNEAGYNKPFMVAVHKPDSVKMADSGSELNGHSEISYRITRKCKPLHAFGDLFT